MGTALLLNSLYAAGIALSPTPVVVVILILFNTTKRRIALAYLMHQPFPVIPLLGTANLDHLHDGLGAASIALTANQVRDLNCA